MSELKRQKEFSGRDARQGEIVLRTPMRKAIFIAGLAGCVLLAVLPGQAEQVCEPLQFREGQLVISLMAGVPLSDIERWCGPAECALACPLPAIAENAGTTIVTPPEPRTVAVFEKLGTAVPVATEDQFKRLQAMTCVMGDLYARHLHEKGVAVHAARRLEAHVQFAPSTLAWIHGALRALLDGSDVPPCC